MITFPEEILAGKLHFFVQCLFLKFPTYVDQLESNTSAKLCYWTVCEIFICVKIKNGKQYWDFQMLPVNTDKNTNNKLIGPACKTITRI